MKIVCPSCAAAYDVPVTALPRIQKMGELKCSRCGNKWTPDLLKLFDEYERQLRQQRQQASRQASHRPRGELNVPRVSPLDKEVAVDWGGEGKTPPRRTSPKEGSPTKGSRFQVRSPRANVSMAPSRQKSKQSEPDKGKSKSPKAFSFGTGATSTKGGFTDKEDVSSTGKSGVVATILAKAKNVGHIKTSMGGLLDKVADKEKIYALLRKEQFWTWAWLGSFGFLIILFFLAYLNWDAILHAWPPASRIYHPD